MRGRKVRQRKRSVLIPIAILVFLTVGGFVCLASNAPFLPDSAGAKQQFTEAMGFGGREIAWVQGGSIGSLHLSAGTDTEYYTFRRTMDLTGTVSAGAKVWIGEFSVLDGKLTMWSLRSAGPGSGLFQEKPNLVWEGANYIVIVTDDAGRLTAGVLTAWRMPEKLEEELAGLTINLYEVFGP